MSNSNFGYNPYQVPTVHINKILFIPTKEYNDVFRRPFEVNVTAENMMSLENTIGQQLERSARLNPISMANAVPNLLRMSDIAGPMVGIANGWGTVRLRFLIEVEKQTGPGTFELCYVQGFTDYHDPSLYGRVDPKMPMHINSITNVIRNITPDNRILTRVLNSFNILSDPYGRGYTIEDTSVKHRMLRPKDVSDGIHANSIVGSQYITTTDIRSAYGAMPFESKRSNVIAPVHVAEIFNSFLYSKESTNIGYDTDDLFDPASAKLEERNMMRTSFIEALSNLTGIPGTVTFDLSMLQLLRPDLENVLHITDNSMQPINQNSLLDTAHTERLDVVSMENSIANLLSENISSLLLEEMLSVIDFSITNMTSNSQLVHAISNAKSFIHGIDIVIYAERFMEKLKTLVMPTVTKGNLIGVEIYAHADIVGDTTIGVSLNGAAPIVFRLPTFCNSLYTPIISDDNNYNTVVNDMSNILSIAGIDVR